MGCVSIRSLSKVASLICFVSTIVFLFFALALFNFLPAAVFFLFLAVLGAFAGVYFRKQQ